MTDNPRTLDQEAVWDSDSTGLTRRQFVLWALGTSLLSMPLNLALAAEPHEGMLYRHLGSTGEKISAIGLGGYHIGVPNENEGIQIIRTAVDKGVNFMDNCWDYHGGKAKSEWAKPCKTATETKFS